MNRENLDKERSLLAEKIKNKKETVNKTNNVQKKHDNKLMNEV